MMTNRGLPTGGAGSGIGAPTPCGGNSGLTGPQAARPRARSAVRRRGAKAGRALEFIRGSAASYRKAAAKRNAAVRPRPEGPRTLELPAPQSVVNSRFGGGFVGLVVVPFGAAVDFGGAVGLVATVGFEAAVVVLGT